MTPFAMQAPASESLSIEKPSLTTLDKALSVVANSSLVLAIGLGTFMMLATPGQPLDFLFSGTCSAGL